MGERGTSIHCHNANPVISSVHPLPDSSCGNYAERVPEPISRPSPVRPDLHTVGCGSPCACEINQSGDACQGGSSNGCASLPCSDCPEVGCNWCVNGPCQPMFMECSPSFAQPTPKPPSKHTPVIQVV